MTIQLQGNTYDLVIHQSISIPHLGNHLLCPIQACVNDVNIIEISNCFASNLTNETHYIIVTDPDDPSQRLIFPLAMHGVTMYLLTQHITKESWESGLYPSLELTNEFL